MKKKFLPESMRSGNEEVDAEHELIFHLIEVIKDGESRADVPKNYLMEVVHILTAVTGSHLNHEDQLMQKIGYPDTERHRKSHDFLRDLLKRLESDFNGYSENLGKLLLEIISSYLVRHIDQCDLKLIEYLKTGRPQN